MATSAAPGAPIDAAGGGSAPARLGLALVVIAAAQLMVVLDASIVNIALPQIQKELEFSDANLAWVVNGYTLAFGGLLLLGGRAGDMFGRRKVFILGIALFTLASLACGLATSETWLIIARVFQGVGAAIASPTALSLITTTFPEGGPRNRAMGVYAAMSGAGAAVGLIAGGLLTEYLNWRWVFFVNIPFGVVAMTLAPRVLKESVPQTGKIDIVGAFLGTLGITSLVYGITRTTDHGWSDPVTVASFVAAVVLLAVFIVVESRVQDPIMPLHLFRDRNRSGAFAVMLLVGAGLFGMFYFMSLYIQGILGYTPVQAGLAFIPFTVGIVVGAGTASQLAPKLPARVIAGVGLVLGTFGVFLFSQLEVSSTYTTGLLIPMIFTSIGMGLVFVPLTLAVLSGVSDDESGIASALLNTMQQVGGSLGLAVLATIAATTTNNELPGASGKLIQGLTTGDFALVAQAQAALTNGYTQAFLVSAGILSAALLITIGAINAKKQEAGAGAVTHIG